MGKGLKFEGRVFNWKTATCRQVSMGQRRSERERERASKLSESKG